MLTLANQVGAVGYSLAAIAFLALWLMLMTGWRQRLQGLYLLMSVAVSFLWAVVAAVNAYVNSDGLAFSMLTMEFFMMAAWLIVLVKMASMETGAFLTNKNRLFVIVFFLLVLYELALLISMFFFPAGMAIAQAFLIGFVVLSVLGLVLVEQLYRNTKSEKRWAIKFFVIGVGGLFAYNFYMYADALLFGRLDAVIWIVRGYAAILLVPLITIFVMRNPTWSFDLFISRGVVFHSVALLSVGVYLLVMAAGGYYIQVFGGDWGRAFQLFFLFASMLLLAVILLSGRFRSRLRVFINKHFFNYKYDYREEWLGFTNALSAPVGTEGDIYSPLLRALLDIVDSPEGVLWVASEDGFKQQARVGMAGYSGRVIASDERIILFLKETEWVINLDELIEKPGLYRGLVFPEWMIIDRQGWLVVPLFDGEHLIALTLFSRPRSERIFNWEDSDLLKAAGRQAAVSLSQYQMSQRLVDARQFEAYNHFSTFVIHDIKNMVAQLSLMVRNADKHKHNPEFVDDMIATTRHSVGKMERLITQLRTGKESYFQPQVSRVNLKEVLNCVVEEKSKGEPCPKLNAMPELALFVEVEKERLEAIIGHLLQNAQDASPAEGEVTIGCIAESGNVRITISDTGSGMSESFVQHRLFRPFDSTKGSAGMGIGAYESREYILQVGGVLEVESEEGVGSSFHVTLPLILKAGERVKE
ncbi:MAG: PEP-CTERM system histidine kinase PrsK [Thiotrichales bacterium]|nr:MAG: PEP-CTERM system histidine kinase PrsK [Thiotrichales bacterium]